MTGVHAGASLAGNDSSDASSTTSYGEDGAGGGGVRSMTRASARAQPRQPVGRAELRLGAVPDFTITRPCALPEFDDDVAHVMARGAD